MLHKHNLIFLLSRLQVEMRMEITHCWQTRWLISKTINGNNNIINQMIMILPYPIRYGKLHLLTKTKKQTLVKRMNANANTNVCENVYKNSTQLVQLVYCSSNGDIRIVMIIMARNKWHKNCMCKCVFCRWEWIFYVAQLPNH